MEDTQTLENTPETDGPPPLWKQVMGAVIGGALALGVYYAYEYAKPKVTAYLTLPVAEGGRLYDLGAASIADKSLEDRERKRFISKNMQAAARIEGREFDQSMIAAIDNHSMDIDRQPPEQEVAEEEPTVVAAVVEEEMQEQDPTEHSELGHNVDGARWNPEGWEESAEEDYEMMEPMEQEEMNAEDWDSLWGEIADHEEQEHHVEHVNAHALPDTGLGLSVLALGAAGGAWGVRKKRRMNK